MLKKGKCRAIILEGGGAGGEHLSSFVRQNLLKNQREGQIKIFKTLSQLKFGGNSQIIRVYVQLFSVQEQIVQFPTRPNASNCDL